MYSLSTAPLPQLDLDPQPSPWKLGPEHGTLRPIKDRTEKIGQPIELVSTYIFMVKAR